MRFQSGARAALLAAVLSMAALPAYAQNEAAQNAVKSAWQAAAKTVKRGPDAIALLDQATLKLPEGYGFVPKREAAALMKAMGNGDDPEFVGLIVPVREDSDESWLIAVDFDRAGYVNDDDAKNWNADELLENLKTGTEAGNAERIRLGVTPIEVTRWIERPAYDAATRTLIWSAEARDKGAPADADNTVNYNTYVLGREGYVSLNLITSVSSVEAEKPMMKTLVGDVAFVDGKRYADFNASTDKVAAYGLAALIGGVAAKKLGLLAILAAFLAKSFKLVIVALGAAGVALRKFFARKA
ncbi:MAG TPA: DUF2167 domain-containing protein [Rhodanobacteraceae bacterium]|nr:DUF2167 domain-containing protein [Rhodanobacteraceae bacterium]